MLVRNEVYTEAEALAELISRDRLEKALNDGIIKRFSGPGGTFYKAAHNPIFEEMDRGIFNPCIKGYAKIAAADAGLTEEQIRDFMNALRLALSENDAAQALAAYYEL